MVAAMASSRIAGIGISSNTRKPAARLCVAAWRSSPGSLQPPFELVLVVARPSHPRWQGILTAESSGVPPRGGGALGGGLAFDQPEQAGPIDGMFAACCVELEEHVLQVPLDRLLADVHGARDFLVGPADRQ